jgi:hypothetical protein
LSNWLSFLVKELSEGRAPVLTLAEMKNVAKAAVLDERGHFLASELGEDQELAVSNLAAGLQIGQSASMVVGGVNTLSERISGEKALFFWREALNGRDQAWAAWLLTMAKEEGGGPDGPPALKVSRHVLSVSGPFTPPRLSKDGGRWSLLPLNPGLGRLFIFGDDQLALETAAIGSRAGLKVTLASVNSLEFDIRAAQQVGQFELLPVSDWAEVDEEVLTRIGVKTGVVALVTTPNHSSFLEPLKSLKVGWLGLAGDTCVSDKEPGLFPHSVSLSLRALGLVAAILEKNNCRNPEF